MFVSRLLKQLEGLGPMYIAKVGMKVLYFDLRILNVTLIYVHLAVDFSALLLAAQYGLHDAATHAC